MLLCLLDDIPVFGTGGKFAIVPSHDHKSTNDLIISKGLLYFQLNAINVYIYCTLWGEYCVKRHSPSLRLHYYLPLSYLPLCILSLFSSYPFFGHKIQANIASYHYFFECRSFETTHLYVEVYAGDYVLILVFVWSVYYIYTQSRSHFCGHTCSRNFYALSWRWLCSIYKAKLHRMHYIFA